MGKCMDNRYDRNIYCPFYKGTERNIVICCEGPVKNTKIRLGFSRPKYCKDYLEKYCYGKTCEGCRVYQCANAKYEEE